MGFWGWFWIWVALSVGAIAIFALLGRSLWNRAVSAGHQASRLVEKGIALSNAMASKPNIKAPASSLLADPIAIQAQRKAMQKRKTKKHEQRQRRLIASLKRFDPNESRFH